MEPNVWTELFASVADIALNLFASSNNAPKQENPGSLPVAAGNAADLTSTSSHTLRIIRKTESTDAMFGEIYWDNVLVCVSMERTAVAIPVGTFPGCKRYSPHFARIVIGIDVPNRADIECHPANFPLQVRGCVAAGSVRDGDALDNSTAAFEKLMAIATQTFSVVVTSELS